MKRLPKITSTATAGTKVQELSGTVTVGPESAKRLGVPVGTVIDLGVLAYHHPNPLKRFWGNLKASRRNSFNF